MNTILENISKLADNEGVTITKLEQIIGASKGVLSRALAKNSDIQAKWVLKLVENYPQYSCEWLIKSEGSMIKDKNVDNFSLEKSEEKDELTYKNLAESRKQTIEILQKVVSLLEKQVLENEKKEKG
ncbi:hypothetical protein [Flavobacterium sp. LC2016-13]|uniref:hypothetical protein n=1 Tax=Flavobacterium sp. LC2016-13 TaxID=2675875 RepID=UPI0012B75BFB|nr:hypothetical protein [Flavobacterium sp. LC2016-13]MTD71160.1 hypothetical protein [Flavobacterium sp. LC2016-13]